MTEALSRQLLFWPVAVAGTALDLATKSLVFGWLQTLPPEAQTYTSMKGFLTLRMDHNTGTFFGQLGGHNTALIVFTVTMMALVVYMFLAPPREVAGGRRGRCYSAALGLVLAGAAGNLWDRILLGHVRDFLAFAVNGWHWPTFNLADAWLTLGIIAYLLATWRAARTQEPPGEPSAEEAPRP